MKGEDSQAFKIGDAASYDALTAQFDYYTERLTSPLASRLISLAGIKPDEIILDVGTGTGVAALKAAETIESNGMVYAVDLSEKMLSKAQAKANLAKLGQKMKFSLMDAEALDFEEKKFDTVISLFALFHFPNPLAALEEMHRVIRPGGRAVLGVGGGAPLFSLPGWIHLFKKLPDFWRNLKGKQLTAPHLLDSLVKQHLSNGDVPEESHLAGQAHHHRIKTIISLIKKAGFDVVKTDWHGHREIIDTPQEFWEIQRTFSSVSRKRLNNAAPAEIDAVYKAFMEKCRKSKSSGGRLIYPFGAFYIVAKRPARAVTS